MRGRKAEDLTGKTFGRWKVLARAKRRLAYGHTLWECECECGRVGTVVRTSLVRGGSVSCGCYARELAFGKTLRVNPKGSWYVVGSNDVHRPHISCVRVALL